MVPHQHPTQLRLLLWASMAAGPGGQVPEGSSDLQQRSKVHSPRGKTRENTAKLQTPQISTGVITGSNEEQTHTHRNNQGISRFQNVLSFNGLVSNKTSWITSCKPWIAAHSATGRHQSGLPRPAAVAGAPTATQHGGHCGDRSWLSHLKFGLEKTRAVPASH